MVMTKRLLRTTLEESNGIHKGDAALEAARIGG